MLLVSVFGRHCCVTNRRWADVRSGYRPHRETFFATTTPPPLPNCIAHQVIQELTYSTVPCSRIVRVIVKCVSRDGAGFLCLDTITRSSHCHCQDSRKKNAMIFNPHALGVHKLLKHIPLNALFDAPYKARLRKAVNIADLRLIGKARSHKVSFFFPKSSFW